MGKLAEAAWAERPTQITAVFLLTAREANFDEAAVRTAVAQIYDKTDKFALNKSGAARQAELEAETARVIAEKKKARLFIERAYFSQALVRLDQSESTKNPPSDVPENFSYNTTFVLHPRIPIGDGLQFKVDRAARVVTVAREGLWAAPEVLEDIGMPLTVARPLKMRLGRLVSSGGHSQYSADAAKINELLHAPAASSPLRANDLGGGRIQFSFWAGPEFKAPFMDWVCDAMDFAKIYSIRVLAADGTTLKSTELEDYDSSGIPRRAVIRTYDPTTSSLQTESTYLFLSVDIHTKIPPETFALKIPEDAHVQDRRVNPAIDYPPGRFPGLFPATFPSDNGKP